MAQTIVIKYDKGGAVNAPSGTGTDVSTGGGTQIRFQTDDNADNIDGNYPNIKPAAGTNYSYWIHLFIECTARPGTETVNNVKFYTDGGGYGTGVTLNVGNGTQAQSSASQAGYDPATGTQGTTGDVMTDHDTVAAVTDAFTYTSGSPRDVSISEGSLQIDAVGEGSDYVVLQIALATSVTSQTFAAETLTFRYDETL